MKNSLDATVVSLMVQCGNLVKRIAKVKPRPGYCIVGQHPCDQYSWASEAMLRSKAMDHQTDSVVLSERALDNSCPSEAKMRGKLGEVVSDSHGFDSFIFTVVEAAQTTQPGNS